jgi:hypothetical protein
MIFGEHAGVDAEGEAAGAAGSRQDAARAAEPPAEHTQWEPRDEEDGRDGHELAVLPGGGGPPLVVRVRRRAAIAGRR